MTSYSNTNTASNNRPLSKEALAAIPVLRSLIISEKGTSTLKRILNDYCKEEGEPLPFRKFGFPSAVEYLKATGEFVLRTHMGETSIFVKPKADTAHIQKMVAAQKPAKVPVKQKNQYHWNNPQYRFRTFQGQSSSYQPKPQQPVQQLQQQQYKNPNNPLKRFFPTNSSAYYPKISIENVPPPKPANPPKVVPTLTNSNTPYAKVVTAVKVEPRETKPVIKMNENVPPPLQQPTVTQQAFVRPMPNNNYVVKRENPLPSNLPKYVIQSASNQNVFATNPFQNDQFVQQNQLPATNPFATNLPPPGFNYRQPPPVLPKQFIPPQQNQYQVQNNPFKPNNQPPPQPQQQFPTVNRVPFALLQQQQQLKVQTPPPPPPSDPIIDLLDQQVQMLHNSVKTFKTSYQQSRVLLQSTLNQEVKMMEAIVRQYQRTASDQQLRQQAAVDRLNQQLELLHATCRTGQFSAN